MPQIEPQSHESGLTANQRVAHNLRRARALHGLTQEEAAVRLEPFIGRRWSKASWSAAERSVVNGRVRQFDADEIAAFAQAFGRDVSFFFESPQPFSARADLLPKVDE